jgi:hypothetical protein
MRIETLNAGQKKNNFTSNHFRARPLVMSPRAHGLVVMIAVQTCMVLPWNRILNMIRKLVAVKYHVHLSIIMDDLGEALIFVYNADARAQMP